MDGAAVRTLLRGASAATLATHDDATGAPYASLVEVATTMDARPILLLSDLARHTRNLGSNPHVSLLVDQRQSADQPLAAPRATLVGRLDRTDDPDWRRRYVARHPDAVAYVDFADFGFWLMEPAVAHAIAGFGRIVEVAAGDIVLAAEKIANIGACEGNLIEEINHLNLAHGLPWRAVGLDPEGIDVLGPKGRRRLPMTIANGEIDRVALAAVRHLAAWH